MRFCQVDAACEPVAECVADTPVETSVWHDRSVYRWISAYSAALVSARREFGGDLDRLVIFLVFVQADLSRRHSGREGHVGGINTLSVADITLVPRETTRRKLHELVESGHVRRGPDSLWYLSESISCEAWISGASGLFDRELQQRIAAASSSVGERSDSRRQLGFWQ